MTVSSTDPAKSNSGFTLAQLELNIIAADDVFSAPSLAQARTALPTVRALYDAQGLQAGSSDFGFKQWLTQAEQIRTTTPPNAEVTLALLACMKDSSKCA